jgi:pyruvate dehydrogenase E2 component (dihydrolipoamide acetyltransferase)
VRRFARELGVEVADVAGSGPAGRVTMEDVKTHVRAGAGARSAAVPAAAPLPDFSKWGPVQREKMSNVRRATARNMAQSWPTIPMVTQFDKADITELEQLRQQFGKRVEAAGGKLTPTAIILKVVAAALKRFPQFNASVDMASEEIVYKQYVHVGVAVDTDRGLLVPVLRDVDQKNVIQLAVELGQIAQKARDRKLGLEDMQGGCFTISNLGGIGGTGFTPLVNGPEVAILGVSRGSLEPVWVEGQWQGRQLLPLSLTYDHRLIDGADGARFLRWVCEALEKPFLLMLEG